MKPPRARYVAEIAGQQLDFFELNHVTTPFQSLVPSKMGVSRALMPMPATPAEAKYVAMPPRPCPHVLDQSMPELARPYLPGWYLAQASNVVHGLRALPHCPTSIFLSAQTLGRFSGAVPASLSRGDWRRLLRDVRRFLLFVQPSPRRPCPGQVGAHLIE